MSVEELGLCLTVVGLVFGLAGFFINRYLPRSAADPEARRANELRAEHLELDRDHDRRERLDRLLEQAPKWEPAKDGEAGYFVADQAELRGELRNVGVSTAQVCLARLDSDGQVVKIGLRCDPPHGGGGFGPTATVPPGSVLSMRCDVTGIELHRRSARPNIYIEFRAIGAAVGSVGVTIPLLRTGEDVRGRPRWRLGEPLATAA